jgi:hypothetical protein
MKITRQSSSKRKMKPKPSNPKITSSAAPSASQIKKQLENLMSKVSWGKNGKLLVLEKGTIILTPEVRARMIKPVTEEIPLLGEKIKHEIMGLKKRADAGDDVALGVLYNVTMFGVLALNSAHNQEAVKSIAQNKSLWPVMGSSEDSIIKRNDELFAGIGLGSKMTTRPIPDLLRNDSVELLWAVMIAAEINRMRDFLVSLSPETKADLFNKGQALWPFKIRTGTVLLQSENIVECGSLPPLSGGNETKNLWWVVIEKLFEIVTDQKWEEIPELRNTHLLAAKNHSSNLAHIRTYIRSNIKKNLKNKFFTRVAPSS